jgi:hypothetical protein
VKYEELVEQPMRVVRALCELIGERYEPRMLQVTDHNSSHEGGEGIFASSAGRWRSLAEDEDVRIAEWVNAPELRLLGYPVTVRKIGVLTLGGSLASLPVAAVRAVYANRQYRGPLVPYLLRRATGCLKRASL